MKRLSSCSCVVAALTAWACLPGNTYTESEPDAQAVKGDEDKDDEDDTKDPPADEDDPSDDETTSTDTDDDTSSPSMTTTSPPDQTTGSPSMNPTRPPDEDTDDSDDGPAPTAPDPTQEPDDGQIDDGEPDDGQVDDGAGGANADDSSDGDPTDSSPEPSTDDTGNPPDDTDPPAPPDGDYFGDSRCSDEFVLCEDFESGELDSELWEAQGPAPEIDDGLAARGSRSAHFHTEDNGLSLIRTYGAFPMPNNRYYARAFVYFDAMPTAPAWAHWTISGAAGSGTEAEIRTGGQYDNNINRFGVGTDRGPTGDWTNLDEDPAGSPLPVPTGEWVCLEWMHDGENQESRFWWDDQEHPSLFTSASEHGGSDDEYLLPDFESVWFGWWLYQPDTEPGQFDVWIDEIVIDDEPIGCAR